jgi:hypothetical protein
MKFFVRSDRPTVHNVLCQTLEQAEDCRDELKAKYPDQEFAIIPSGEATSAEIERAPVLSRPGYGLSRARLGSHRPAARGSKSLKSGSKSSKGGISAGGGRKRKKKQGKK